MAIKKNALRGHFLIDFDPASPTAPDAETGTWLELAKYIITIDDDSDEDTEDNAFYDGDGTTETTVMGVAIGYSFEGYFDPEDDAQALVAGKKVKIGEGRKLWHKVVSSDGLTTYLGRATVTDIVAGAGDANEFEEFSCTIVYDQIPTVIANTTP